MRKWYLKCLGCNMYSILTEIWRDDKGILVERDDDKCRYYIPNDELSFKYVEYKEPRKVEGWVNVYDSPDGPRFGLVFNTRESAVASGNQAPEVFIDTVKVTWTEGE